MKTKKGSDWTWTMARPLGASGKTAIDADGGGDTQADAATQGPRIVSRQALFTPSSSTFPLYRIPALAALNSSHVIAFAEARDKHVTSQAICLGYCVDF